MVESLKYDVLVIGSGLAGLMSAVILAKEGKHVCVLEKNNQFGGNLQTFSRNKKIFDTGVHYIGGLEKGQNLYKYFSYVGIMDQLRLKKMPRVVDQICFGSNTTKYPIAQGYEAFVEELSVYFPKDVHTILQYITDLQTTVAQFPLYNVLDSDKTMHELMQIGVKDYMDQLTDNKELKAVLMGNNFLYAAEGDYTPFFVHALTINSYIMSAYQCVNGGSQISKLLVKELRRLGGVAVRRCEVDTIAVSNGKVDFVETKTKLRYEAETYISNIDPSLVLNMIGREHFRSVYYDRVMSLPLTISSFSGHFVLKARTVTYNPSNVYYHHRMEDVWQASGYKEETWPNTLMISMTEDPENPGFADTLTGLTYMHFAEVNDWAASFNTVVNGSDRGETYQSYKQVKLNKMVKVIEKSIPHFSSAVDARYATTPLSYRDYIGSRAGNLYGALKDVNEPLNGMLSPKTKISNLFLTGQGVSMHGILGVTIGAIAACAEIVGRKYLMQKIIHETCS